MAGLAVIWKKLSFLRQRVLVSFTIGLMSGTFCWYFLRHFDLRGGDFKWALQAAQDVLAHKNPYDNPQQLYPLTAALFGLPFLWLPPDTASGAFYGISSALLAFGVSKNGFKGLLIFFAYPYWAGLITAQWAPLIMASAFFSFLVPAALAKPQLGLPITLANLDRRRLLLCFLIMLVSLILMPRWPFFWISNAGSYNRYIPLIIFPGPLLLLGMLRYRDRDVHLLLLMALMPQRWFYDTFMLWLIPKTRREIIWTSFFSWGAGLWRWYHIPPSFQQVGRWTLVFIYIPMLCTIFARPKETGAERVLYRPVPGA